MANPLHTLSASFCSAVRLAFGEEYAAVDPVVRPSRFADFQVNASLGLAKVLKRPPREVATAILDKLDAGDVIERVEIAGPGFINVWLKTSFLARELTRMADGALGLEPPASVEQVVIDYSSPNVAKEMHVGHLRSSIIGDALARTFEALGHTVLRQNHIGDWGTPFGMLIEHLTDGGADAAKQSMSDLNAFYQAARKKFDEDASFAERARQRVVALQAGDTATLELWRTLVAASMRYFESVYAMLGITLRPEHVAGESFYNDSLASVVTELSERGIAVESDGAICVFPPGFTGREGQPVPLIVRKQDGGYGYATTDLAAIRHRVRTLGATRVLYVVGAPQSQHLSMVFATARLMGWLPESVRAEHVAFGSVLGTDKKMYRTRAGDSTRLIDLLEEGVRRALVVVREKNPSLDGEVTESIARAVGIGAIKYADLSSDRVKDYVFDWDRMLSLDGNTAPYLQYARARCASILRKAALREAGEPSGTRFDVEHPAERTLALQLLAFPTVVNEVADTLAPHKLCGYLYEVATAFSTFFESCPVLKADTEDARAARLALTQLTAHVLERGLDLLGIETPDRM